MKKLALNKLLAAFDLITGRQLCKSSLVCLAAASWRNSNEMERGRERRRGGKVEEGYNNLMIQLSCTGIQILKM